MGPEERNREVRELDVAIASLPEDSSVRRDLEARRAVLVAYELDVASKTSASVSAGTEKSASKAGMASVLLAVVALLAIFLPGGFTWFAFLPAVGAITAGVTALTRDGARGVAITGLLIGSGIAGLLVVLLLRIAWLNFG
jgi:hypothetical protein